MVGAGEVPDVALRSLSRLTDLRTFECNSILRFTGLTPLMMPLLLPSLFLMPWSLPELRCHDLRGCSTCVSCRLPMALLALDSTLSARCLDRGAVSVTCLQQYRDSSSRVNHVHCCRLGVKD